MQNEKENGLVRRSAIWSLGHIALTSFGLKSICSLDENFVNYLIKLVISCENFSLRGAAFFALGLVGKSTFGTQLLLKHQWETNTSKVIAVSVPADPAILFTYNKEVDDPVHPRSRTEDMGLFRALYPFIQPGRVNLEVEVMSNISQVFS